MFALLGSIHSISLRHFADVEWTIGVAGIPLGRRESQERSNSRNSRSTPSHQQENLIALLIHISLDEQGFLSDHTHKFRNACGYSSMDRAPL
jgi:hypothetical protein